MSDSVATLRRAALGGSNRARLGYCAALVREHDTDAARQFLSELTAQDERPAAEFLAAELSAMHGFDLEIDWQESLAALAAAGFAPAIVVTRIYAEHQAALAAGDWTECAPESAVAPQVRQRTVGPLLRHFCRQTLGPAMQTASVVDPKTGARVRHPIRRSRAAQWIPEYLAWPGKLLEQLIANVAEFDVSNGEVLTLLNYAPGDEYRAHYDGLPENAVTAAEGGQRIRTVLVNMGDEPFAGGATAFPKLGIEISLGPGDMLRFVNADSEARTLPDSLHLGAPVSSGQKWLLSKWVRESQTPYGRELALGPVQLEP